MRGTPFAAAVAAAAVPETGCLVSIGFPKFGGYARSIAIYPPKTKGGAKIARADAPIKKRPRRCAGRESGYARPVMSKLLITAVLLVAVTGAAVLTGAETKGRRGYCSDGPEGGICVTERFIDWDGPLLFPLVLGAIVVVALAFWLVRRAVRWLTIAVLATAAAVAFAVFGTLSF